MLTTRYNLGTGLLLICSALLALASIDCQYDYYSPQPGTLELQLRSISENIAFLPSNNFTLKVSGIKAVRADQSTANIKEDLKAVQPTTDVFNAFDVRARDSSLVLGMEYIPPGDYTGIDLLIEPGAHVLLDGYREIDVVTLPGFDNTFTFRQPFTVRENAPTKITLTIDLDQTLVRGALVYYFVPHCYISSIQ